MQEARPGGGPAAAVAAAFAAYRSRLAPIVAIVAGDLPLLSPEAVRALLVAAAADGVDGAAYVGEDDRPQWLCGAWRTAAIAIRLDELASALALRARSDRDAADVVALAGVALREVFGPLSLSRLSAASRTDSAEAGVDDPAETEGAIGAVAGAGALPPWFDCDTEEDIRHVEEWLDR
jgi:hypothetical protein